MGHNKATLLLSIVTISRDDAEGLRMTVKSVESQQFDPSLVEQVLVLGGEQSEKVAEPYKQHDLVTNIVTKSDSGIADAFNRGVAVSRGEFVLFLNGGDRLFGQNLKAVIEDRLRYLAKDEFVGIAGASTYADGTGVFQTSKVDPKPSQLHIRSCLPHQSLILPRKLLSSHPFDSSYRIAMDYEQLLRSKPHIVLISQVLTEMAEGGVSRTKVFQTYYEQFRAQREHFHRPMLLDLLILFRNVTIAVLSLRVVGPIRRFLATKVNTS